MSAPPSKKIFIKDLTRPELSLWLSHFGAKPYTAEQVFEWLYKKRAQNFGAMTNIKKELQSKLEGGAEISSLDLARQQNSRLDGTKKFLFKLRRGGKVESVALPFEGRMTACISTQEGCRQACRFCATGAMGFKRDLFSGEIIDQLIQMEQVLGQQISNIVIMGMGEPLDNLENVRKAVFLLNDKDGLNKSSRKVTLSTCGLAPQIEQIAREKWPVSLAVSLNAPEDSLRSSLMPINRRYPLKQLVRSLQAYHSLTGKMVTFEYVLLAGVNDSLDQAKKIPGLVQGIPCKFNLIPFNRSGKKSFIKPDEVSVKIFQDFLLKKGIRTMIRTEKGGDIDAACGQLHAASARISS